MWESVSTDKAGLIPPTVFTTRGIQKCVSVRWRKTKLSDVKDLCRKVSAWTKLE